MTDDVLHYRVPAGQDPAVVLAALERDGHRATPGEGADAGIMTVEYDGADDREAVRSTIAGIHNTDIESEMDESVRSHLEPVRFSDEQ